ncbi:MAG: alpha-hydroxy acid oxidase [Rhodobacteraceae bacterium]|nr:alpha-hydroxy acid oxidase [Paracoccaceae bacterium]
MRYPSIADLRECARRRIPNFAFEYIDSGTGDDRTLERNRDALDRVLFIPEILHGKRDCTLGVSVLDHDWDLPVGVAPVGMSGLMWPGAERRLARAARAHNIPYCLSSVAAASPEEIAPHAGHTAWFQLYVPASRDICTDIIRRVHDSGYQALVLTVDVPAPSRRERQRRAGMGYPPKLSLRLLLEMLLHPSWSLAMAREGTPSLKLLESYVENARRHQDRFIHIGRMIQGCPDWQSIADIRQIWERKLIVKGVQRPEDGLRLRDAGVDAVWVSNHGGRQFDAGPASIAMLRGVRAAVGPDYPVLFDSGIAGGLDVMRALACGADMAFLGRGFHYAVAALGDRGVAHLLHLLRAELVSGMAQIGAFEFGDLASRLANDSLPD